MVNITKFQPRLVTNQPEETKEFLKHFQGNLVISAIGNTAPPSYLNPTDDEWKLIGDQNANDFNIYFTVNDTDGRGRSKENITLCRAIFADDDTPRGKPRTDWALPPSIIVQTSQSTRGFKYHYYWLTETTDHDEWHRVQKGIIGMYETDPSIHDTTRILRLPGFLNCKANPSSECTTVDSNGQRYEWSTIIAKFPPVSKAKANIQAGKTVDGEFNETELRQRFLAGEAGDITECGNRLIAHWRWHYSAVKTKAKAQELIDSIDKDAIDLETAERYFAFQGQLDKFVTSITRKVEAAKIKESISERVVVPICTDLPEALDWDWSVLKSNELPQSCLPPYLYEAASEIGEWNGIGKEPAAISAIFMISALLSKNVVIHETYDSLTHHCRQGVVIVMDTGASKSSIYEHMNAPFFEYEKYLIEQWEKNKNQVAALAKTYKSLIDRKERAFNKKKGEPSPNEILSHASELGKLQDQIDELQLTPPALHSTDLTEEAVFRKLHQNNEAIALISDDARKAINILLGDYKNGQTGEAIYISGLSGTTIIRDRISQETEQRIDNPAINAMFFVQPDKGLDLKNSEMYVPSGLAARMPLYFYPTCGVDIVRNRQRRAINKARMEAYYDHMRAVCVHRFGNPLHIRISERGMGRLKELDNEFADMLEGPWQNEHNITNKLISSALQYATCIAALDDIEFKSKFREVERTNDDYVLSIKYINMGFEFAKILFGQSIKTHNTLNEEAIPRKARTVVNTLTKMYSQGKIYEGFVMQGDFRNFMSPAVREDLPQIIDFLLNKKWLYTSKFMGGKRKLNAGFPNKLVDEGDLIYHLNVQGIKKRVSMKLDQAEESK